MDGINRREYAARMALGKNVGALRERLGLTYEQVAQAVGTTPQNVANLVSRNSRRSEFAGRLAAFFGFSLRELESDAFDPHALPKEQLVARFEAARQPPLPGQSLFLTDQERDLVLAFRALPDDHQHELVGQLMAEAEKYTAYAQRVLRNHGVTGVAPNERVAAALPPAPPPAAAVTLKPREREGGYRSPRHAKAAHKKRA